MGLLEKNLQNLDELEKHYLSGKINKEELSARLAIHKKRAEYAKMLLQIFIADSIATKKSPLPKLRQNNFIGRDRAICVSFDEAEEELFYCPWQEKHITRGNCLDFSGANENHEKCKGCEDGVITKKLLCPP